MSNVGNKGECVYKSICPDYNPLRKVCGSYIIGDRASDCDPFNTISITFMHELANGGTYETAVRKLRLYP